MEEKELRKRISELESANALLKKANQVARDQYIDRVVNAKIAMTFGMFGVIMLIQSLGVFLFNRSAFEGQFVWIVIGFMIVYLVGFCVHMAMLYQQKMKIKAEWKETTAKIEAEVVGSTTE